MFPEKPGTINKTRIINSQGVTYTEYRASLIPKYWRVWLDISTSYLTLVLVLVIAGFVQRHYPSCFWLNIPLGAFLTGYCLYFIHLFIHEAAHYNIAPSRDANDLLANIFVGFIVGADIGYYRIIHFDHHRYLGTVKDTENTYFEGLNWKFFLLSLTGIRPLLMMRRRKEIIKNNERIPGAIQGKNTRMLIAGLCFNILILAVLYRMHYWQVAVVWALAQFVLFPFFNSLRQLLEHRGEHAQASIDYHHTDQGITNRLFGRGFISSVFGGAGFNMHLLHHWDPQVSYTRLKELELFLMDTELSAELGSAHTSYPKTFLNLFAK